MSTRTHLISLESLEPIKAAVGSQDRALLDALAEFTEDDEGYEEWAEAMITGPVPKKEPGCWNYFVEPLAKHLGLSPRMLPLDDWKHYQVWPDYRKQVKRHVPRSAVKRLKLLENGRPFRGAKIDHDGCAFAWLSPEEVASLLGELSPVDASALGDLDEFHEQLVASLRETAERGHALFLGAS